MTSKPPANQKQGVSFLEFLNEEDPNNDPSDNQNSTTESASTKTQKKSTSNLNS